ncbi:MAG: TIGR02301 family protein [Beijerinckiaceae bacterium]|nr:TIGR02301 family protein [Beijerinckiaceae bacterium]
MLRIAILGALVVLFPLTAGPTPAGAQQRPATEQKGRAPPAQQKKEAEPEPPPEQPPPYEPQTLKLAELLGSLAFLTELCGPPDGLNDKDVWRKKAQEFMSVEPMSQARRERFAGAYNRGFQSYRLVYRKCTDNARLSVERLMDDGAKLTREIASRFGS